MRLIDGDKFRLALLILRDAAYTVSGNTDAVDKVLDMLDKQETVDTVKHGHWIHGSSSENIRVTCSECGYKVNYFWDSWQDALYCPRCGAKMDGET